MRFASWTKAGRAGFGIIDAQSGLFDLGARSNGRFSDLKSLIAASPVPDLAMLATGAPDAGLDDVVLRPPLPNPAKTICVGVNYPERNAEYKDGQAAPTKPSLFVRFPSSLVAHGQALLRPPESSELDYEGEIALVIGRPGRRIAKVNAHEHIFGLTLMNEGTIRDWVRHGKFNVTQGKNFERSGSLGPWIVDVNSAGALDNLEVVTRVNGKERQRGNTGTLTFSFASIIAYISTFTTLEPGDLIATGTPPGSGARMTPPRFLAPGDVVEVSCPQIGILRNHVEDEVVGPR